MSLESQIKQLVEAINKNTEAMIALQSDTEQAVTDDKVVPIKEKAKSKSSKGKIEPVETEAETDVIEEEITTEVVKTLAKQKVANGASRDKIKKMTNDLGAKKIVDLDDEGLEKLYAKLQELA